MCKIQSFQKTNFQYFQKLTFRRSIKVNLDEILSNRENKIFSNHDLEINFLLDTDELGNYLENGIDKIDLEFLFEVKFNFIDINKKITLGMPIIVRLIDANDKFLISTGYTLPIAEDKGVPNRLVGSSLSFFI